MSASDTLVKILQQEPGNKVQWLGANGVARAIDPGFVARDFCPRDLAYLTVLRSPVARVKSHMCEVGANFATWQQDTAVGRHASHVTTQIRDNYYVRALGGAAAWDSPEGGLGARHLLEAARTLARFDVVMTVDTLRRDAPAQMGRVGLPGFRWRRSFARSRADNLQRAAREPWLRTWGVASCEVPPSDAQRSRLVAAIAWDSVLYEFARLLAARRTESV